MVVYLKTFIHTGVYILREHMHISSVELMWISQCQMELQPQSLLKELSLLVRVYKSH